MSAELELALLVLYAAVTNDVDGLQVGVPTLNERVEGTGAVDALEQAAAVARSDSLSPTDRVAIAQAFVLGVRYPRAREEGEAQLHRLAKAMLISAGVHEPSETETGTLIGTVGMLSSEEAVHLDQDTRLALVDELASAFGEALLVERVVPGSRVFSGPAAPTATLVYELATNGVQCRSQVETIPVKGVDKEVILVEVDVCTSLPFERCSRGIDPRRWPTYNPYFVSVNVVGTKTQSPSGDGWAGVIKEKVGPALNGTYYETDLAVRYLEQTRLAVVAFDLANFRNDDGRVTVDRGFVSVTDEGTHRRMRVLKVYRIEDLTMPQDFVCPLWAWQVVLSGWWVPAQEAMERLLRAWAWLAKDAVAAGRGLYDSFHGRKDPVEAKDVRPGPVGVARGSERYTLVVGGACAPAYIGPGEVRLGMQTSKVAVPLQRVNVRRVEPGQVQMPQANPAAKRPVLQPNQDFVDVAIDAVPPWGLYGGRVQDAAGKVDSPFLIYLDGLP